MTETNNFPNNVASPSGPRQQFSSQLSTPVSIRSLSEYLTNIDSNTTPCTSLINTKMTLLSHEHSLLDACSTSIMPCNQPKCLTCPILNTSHFYRSTITNRVYHIDFQGINCKSRNLIYLLTCNGCHAQYVGETSQNLHKRINGHRSSVNVEPGQISGNRLLCTHFTLNRTCRSSGFSVQVIHIFDDTFPDSDRKFIERKFMSKLRTCYPYGLNDRYLNTDLFDNNKDLNVFELCFTSLEEIKPSNFNAIKNDPSLFSTTPPSFSTPQEFFVFCMYKFCKCHDINPCMELIPFVIRTCNSSTKSFARQFAKYVAHTLHSTIDTKVNQQFLYACLDIFNHKLLISTPSLHNVKFPPKFLLKLTFVHKIIEDLRIERFIRSSQFSKLFPVTLTEFPTVVYTYSEPLSTRIFNYSDTFKNSDMQSFINNFMINTSPSCECHSSLFKDPYHNHIVTGNLEIISHPGLRSLFSLGANFKPVPKLKIPNVLSSLQSDFKSCIEVWSNKLNIPSITFQPLLNYFTDHCNSRLSFFQPNYSHSYSSSLNDNELKQELKMLQDKFVITPIDKAPNNIGLTCKWYSIFVTLKELGLLPHTNNPTYINTHLQESEVIDYVRTDFPFSNLKLFDENNPVLPFIYPIPKLHKNPIKFRFIISSVKTYLKPALKACANIFRSVLDQQSWYCNYLHSITGIKRMWICKNSQEIMNSIEHINNLNSAHDTESFDFSTLYTNFNHDTLLHNIDWCFNKTFNRYNRQFITFSSTDTKRSKFSATPGKNFSFDKKQCSQLHTWIVRNLYFKCGKLVLIQHIGIPIGADPAPFQADLALHKSEYEFIENLCQKKQYNTARTFEYTHRYLDDINPKNNFGNFAKFKDSIYAPGLVINKENDGTFNTSMLDIDMTIDPTFNKFNTKLYDKRNSFGFPIVKYPHSKSNIHSNTVYNTFVTQLIRISRVCNNLSHFLFALKDLFDTMILKGCTKHRLIKKLYTIFIKKDLFNKFNIKKDVKVLQKSLSPYLKS